MRRYLVLVLLACAFPVHALESLRVGSQVLVVGDSAARVRALLGKPDGHAKRGGAGKTSSKGPTTRKNKSPHGKSSKSSTGDKGEKWQYWRDGHATTITIVDGKVAHIEDVAR